MRSPISTAARPSRRRRCAEPEAVSPTADLQPAVSSPAGAGSHARPADEAAHEAAQEAERAAARRRSTVREKVSFFTLRQPKRRRPRRSAHSEPEPAPPRAGTGRARACRNRGSRATQGRMVVAALRRRRVSEAAQVSSNGKTARQNRAVFRSGALARSRKSRRSIFFRIPGSACGCRGNDRVGCQPVVIAVSTSVGSICLLRLACSLS